MAMRHRCQHSLQRQPVYICRGGSTIGARQRDPGQVSPAWPGQESTTWKWGSTVPGATCPSSPPAQTAHAESHQYHGASSEQRADRQMDTLRGAQAAGWPRYTSASHLCELSHQPPTSPSATTQQLFLSPGPQSCRR